MNVDQLHAGLEDEFNFATFFCFLKFLKRTNHILWFIAFCEQTLFILLKPNTMFKGMQSSLRYTSRFSTSLRAFSTLSPPIPSSAPHIPAYNETPNRAVANPLFTGKSRSVCFLIFVLIVCLIV